MAFLKEVILNIFIAPIITQIEIISLNIQFLSFKIQLSKNAKAMKKDTTSVILI